MGVPCGTPFFFRNLLSLLLRVSSGRVMMRHYPAWQDSGSRKPERGIRPRQRATTGDGLLFSR